MTVRNVVLVVVDPLRRDRVGVLDADRGLTPTVDRLADDGTVFENAFAATNATDPSMTSIHTGRDPAAVVRHHGPYVTDEEKRRAEAIRSLPERVQEQSVTTMATGRLLSRWHKSGFDHYPESALSRNRRRRLGQHLERIHPGLRSVARWLYETLSSEGSDADWSDAVDTLLSTVDDGPFYGLVHLIDTYGPYDPDPSLVEDLLNRYDYSQRDLKTFL